MCFPENCNAVREAAGGRGTRDGSRVADQPGLRARLDGERINHKRLHRVYCAMKLNLPRRTKRRLPTRLRQPLLAPNRLNEIWALDFMADALYGGRPFRTLNVIDEGNREVLAIEIATSIPARRVIRVMAQLIELHGKPRALRLDNGSELTSTAFTEWCAGQLIACRVRLKSWSGSIIVLRSVRAAVRARRIKNRSPAPAGRSWRVAP